MSMNIFPSQRLAANKSSVDLALDSLQSSLLNKGNEIIGNGQLTRVTLGMENANLDVMQSTGETIEEMVVGFESAIQAKAGVEVGDFAEDEIAFESGMLNIDGTVAKVVPVFNREAAAAAMLALGNPEEYHTAASTVSYSVESGETMVRPFSHNAVGAIPLFDKVSMESYDTTGLNNFQALSVAFNGGGARQDAFGELFFDTKVIGADQNGIQVTIRPTMVMDDPIHGVKGDPMNFARQRLVDAIRRPSILASNTTELHPTITGDNADKFYTEDSITMEPTIVSGQSVERGWLRTGPEMDLISLSNHPGLIGAHVLDSSDSIDPPLGIARMLLRVTNAAGDKVEYFDWDTNMFHGAQFQTPTEGKGREQLLNLNFERLDISPNKKAYGNVASELFETVQQAGYSVGLKGRWNGTVDVELGNVQLNRTELVVSSLVGPDGTAVALDKPGIGKTLVDSLGRIEIVAWYPAGNRSNLNLRQRGKLLTYIERRFRYAIPLKAPMSVIMPTSRQSADAAVLQSLTSAIRVRNSNDAVFTLFNYADHLNQVVNVQKDMGNLHGIGGLVVDPFYVEQEFDVMEVVKSMQSHTRQLDVSTLLMDKIHDLVHEGLAESNYKAALEHTDLNPNSGFTVCIGTDQQTVRHLTVLGDRRTTQLGYDVLVAATNNELMRMYEDREVNGETVREDVGEIFVTLKRPGVAPNGIDPLSFGIHAWTSELVSINPISRWGQTSKEVTVQPRSLHICALPFLIRLRVRNLRRALTETPKQ